MEAAIAVPLPEEGAPVDSAAEGASAGLARAAGINSLGNVASRLLGLVRETVVAGTFGVSGATSSFDPSATFQDDLRIAGGVLLSAALVPVLSEYAVPGRQKELERILSVLLSLVAVVMVAVVALLEVFAPQVAVILLPGFKNDPQLLHTAILLVRLIVPSTFYGLSGILQAYHYARQRFVYPAMGAPAHNLGVILAVLLLAGRLDVASLSVSIVVAAASQLLAQLPGLRGTHLRFQIDFRHPVVRRILRLYAPVVFSVIVQNIGIVIDRNLASQTVPEAITWMTKATFLIQLPLGLVSMAISLAVLPVLSQIDARNELDSFKRTFSMGIRLVLVVILPSTAAVLAFGGPLIRLVFEHGQFTAWIRRRLRGRCCTICPACLQRHRSAAGLCFLCSKRHPHAGDRGHHLRDGLSGRGAIIGLCGRPGLSRLSGRQFRSGHQPCPHHAGAVRAALSRSAWLRRHSHQRSGPGLLGCRGSVGLWQLCVRGPSSAGRPPARGARGIGGHGAFRGHLRGASPTPGHPRDRPGVGRGNSSAGPQFRLSAEPASDTICRASRRGDSPPRRPAPPPASWPRGRGCGIPAGQTGCHRRNPGGPGDGRKSPPH